MKNGRRTTKKVEKPVTRDYLTNELQVVTKDYLKNDLQVVTKDYLINDLQIVTKDYLLNDLQIVTKDYLLNDLQIVTKDYLEKELLATRKYVDKKFDEQNDRNLKYFATKDEMKEEFRKVREEMMTKKDKNEIMTILDSIVKTLIDIKTELAANVGAHERYDERFNDHEERLRYLEACPVMRC